MSSYYQLATLIQDKALKYGKRTALKHFDKKCKQWKTISWRKFAENVEKVAWAMAELGVKEQSNIGIFSQNMPQYFYVDFGAYGNRAATVPIYATSSTSQVKYIVENAEIEYLFVGEQFQYNNAYKVQQETSTIKKIIVFDNDVKFHKDDKTSVYFDYFITTGDNSEAQVLVKVRQQATKETDTASIIYTSGTTGEPKGVVLPHSCFHEVFRIHDILLNPLLGSKESSVCFLPLAHIFEKAWSYYCLHRSATIAINQDPKEIQKTIRQIKPTMFCSVPRFWEKVYIGVKDKVESSKGIMRWLFIDAIKTGKKHNIDYKNAGKTPPIGNSIKFHIYNNTIFRILKTVIGIQHGKLFPTAGAPLSDNINEFLQSVNIPIIVGYGLSETSASVSCYPLGEPFIMGSIGKPLAGIDVKISDEGEILVKAKTVMKEYYRKPEATKESFTEDGYFRTGDAGHIENGVLFLTDRIKDLFKTSNGKYIAPQALETVIAEDKYIDTVAIIADNRKFVSAIVVPDFPALREYAKENNIAFDNNTSLVENEEIKRFINARIELKQAGFATFEKIKKYILVDAPFSIESGEFTNTLKVKRKFVEQKFKEQLDKLYQE